MMQCYHCGSNFTDPVLEALHKALSKDVPMERHGEPGMLLGFDQAELCQPCRSLPPGQLGKIIMEMIELRLRKHHGRLS